MAAPLSVLPPKVLDRSKVEPTAERIDSWNKKIIDAAPHLAATKLFENEIKWVHFKFDKCGTRAYPAAFTSDGHPLVKIDPDSWGPRALEIVMPPAQVAWASTGPKRQVGTKKDGGGINPDATPQFCIKFMQTEDKRYKEELNAEFRRVGLMLEKLINIDRCTYLAKNAEDLGCYKLRLEKLGGDTEKLANQLIEALDDSENHLASRKSPVTGVSSRNLVVPDFDRGRMPLPHNNPRPEDARYLNEMEQAIKIADRDVNENLHALKIFRDQITQSLQTKIGDDGVVQDPKPKTLSPVQHFDSKGNKISSAQLLKYIRPQNAIASVHLKISGLKPSWHENNKKKDPKMSMQVDVVAVRWFVNGEEYKKQEIVVDATEDYSDDDFITAEQSEPAPTPQPPASPDDALMMEAAAEAEESVASAPPPPQAEEVPDRTPSKRPSSGSGGGKGKRSKKNQAAKTPRVVKEDDDVEDGFSES